jgi:hypothetical protein
MANLDVTALANFIPEIWANTALETLRNQIVAAKMIRKDSEIASFSVGDILNIPVPGTFVTNDKAAGVAVTLQAPSAGTVAVTLNKHKEVSFIVEDIARAQANQDTIAAYVNNAAVAIAEKIEVDVLALTAGFSTTKGTPGVAASAAGLRSVRAALNTNKAPFAGRFVIVGPQGEVDLLADAELRDYFANSKPLAVSEAAIGRVYGMDIFMSQLVASSGVGATGMAGTAEMGVLAMRSLPVTGAPGVSQIAMRDPVSGLIIRQTASYDTSMLGVKITLDVLYGVAELRDACGVVYTTTK